MWLAIAGEGGVGERDVFKNRSVGQQLGARDCMLCDDVLTQDRTVEHDSEDFDTIFTAPSPPPPTSSGLLGLLGLVLPEVQPAAVARFCHASEPIAAPASETPRIFRVRPNEGQCRRSRPVSVGCVAAPWVRRLGHIYGTSGIRAQRSVLSARFGFVSRGCLSNSLVSEML